MICIDIKEREEKEKYGGVFICVLSSHVIECYYVSVILHNLEVY